MDNVVVIRLALSLEGAGTGCGARDTVVAGYLGGGIGEGVAGEGEWRGIGGGPGDG